MERKRLLRRRQYLVNRPLQFRFAFIMIWLVVAVAMVAVTVVYSTTWDLLLQELAKPHFPAVHLVVAKVNIRLAILMAIIAVASVLVGLALGVLSLHRIAGPSYRMGRTLREMAKGVLPVRVKLRRKDYLKDLAEDLNTMIESVRTEREKGQQEIAVLSQSIEKAIERARSVGAASVVAELEQALARIRSLGREAVR